MIYPPEWNKKRKEEDVNIQMQAVSMGIFGGTSHTVFLAVTESILPLGSPKSIL
jgi:hypothetical protein